MAIKTGINTNADYKKLDMKMTRQVLENYRRNLKEIESISYQLERLYKEQERLRDNIVSDSVQASNPEYPYNLQHHRVEGFESVSDSGENYAIRKQIGKLNRLQKSLTKATIEVVEYINSLDDGNVKSIITYRILGGHSWRVVAKKMGAGYTEESVKQIYSRHVRKLS